MKRWRKESDSGARFLTGNCHRRVPIFADAECELILLKSLDTCRRKYNFKVHAFVVMPDHFHLIPGINRENQLSNFLRDWEGYAGRQIVKRLLRTERFDLLRRLRLDTPSRTRDLRYRVFQPDTHVEGIYTEDFFRQKMDYIHRNPVRAGLAPGASDYEYSSAHVPTGTSRRVFQVDQLEW